jgi:hypothetical protein
LLKYLALPFYRISILLKDDKVVQGIRQHENSNIDYVTNVFRLKAISSYGNKFVDIEAAMLSKNSPAVRTYLADKLKKIKYKKQWGNKPKEDTNAKTVNYRKINKQNKPPLGERTNNKEKDD